MHVATQATASAIFVATYVLMATGVVHRALAALAGAVAMATAGILFGFYPMAEVAASLDLDTLWLLFAMMALVGLLRETGFFQFLAIRAAKLARGRPLVLFISFGVTTAVASMLLDNVTTLLTVIPVTISVTEILGIPAQPLILMEAVAANVGGAATLVGDPPNILIGSAGGLTFNDFLTRAAPVALIALVFSLAVLLLRFRSQVEGRPEQAETLRQMDERRAVSDPSTMKKLVGLLILTFVLFILHGPLGLPPGLVALIGASLGIYVLRPSVETFLRGVEWDLLIFLGSLFVLTGGLERSGVLNVLSRGIVRATGSSPLVLALMVLWVGAILSWFLSSVPAAVTLVGLVRGVAGAGVPVTPLWWALALGVGLGASGSPLGSASNLIAQALAQRSRYPLSARLWLREAGLLTVATCAMASLFVWLGVITGWYL